MLTDELPLVVVAKEANVNLIVLFLHDFGWPKPETFHFSPNQLMIRYLEIKLFSFVTLLSRDKCKDTINSEYVKYNPLL
jgi:hypothetical protein